MTPNPETSGASASSSFSYADEPSNRWQELLRDARAAGASTVSVPIYWGAHESLQGTRDFSKSSRLRLERFLQIAQEVGLDASVTIGFPPGRETLPAWTGALPSKTLVPASAADRVGLALIPIPSLHSPAFRDAFFGFVDEAFSILSLYRKPEGPVARVLVDFGAYASDFCAMESAGYLRALQSRYPTIQALNSCYTTSFNGFDAVTTRQGLRVLNDRRGWLAAFDYKWCREVALQALRSEIAKLPSAAPLADLFAADESGSSLPSTGSAWGIAFEATLLEVPRRGACFPFAPGGNITELAANAFRLWEYFADHAGRDGRDLTLLPLWRAETLSLPPLAVVVSGKYLSQAAFHALAEHLEAGGGIFFPLGLPQYDERMGSHPWGPSRDRTFTTLAGVQLSRFTRGAGTVWFASPALPFADSLWGSVAAIASSLGQEGGNA